jgi:hypothetical protein
MAMAVTAGWLLVMHAIDIYWLVLPSLHPDTPHPHWSSLTAFVGVGGVAIAAALRLARGEHAVPIREPYLMHSIKVPLP